MAKLSSRELDEKLSTLLADKTALDAELYPFGKRA